MLYHKLLHFYLGNRIKQNHYLPAGTVYGKRTKRKKKQERYTVIPCGCYTFKKIMYAF